MPRSARNVASLAGVSPSHDSARMRAPGCRWRTMPSSARPCRLTSATSCSDQPSRAAARLKADALGRQSVSSGGNGAQQQVADAVMERIAARQHDDRPAAMLLDLGQRVADRARPGERAAADQRLGQAEMALAADHQLGRRHQLLRHRRQAFDAVLADADDGQPARARAACRVSHARSHSRRHHGSLGAGPASRGRSALRGDPVARRPHRRAPSRSPSRRASAASAAPMALRAIIEEQAIEAVIDATHPYADHDLGQCRRRLRAQPACRWPRWSAPPGSLRPGDNWQNVPPTGGAAALPSARNRAACS